MSESSSRLKDLVGSLRSQGHRLTPQRMAVLRILAMSTAHPSAQDIYRQVQVDFPMTSLATVYKTISLLKEMGQVLELGFSDESSRYDGRKPAPHPHLICVQCKEIVDWESNALAKLAWQIAQESGYQVIGHRLDLFGLCPECQKKNPSGGSNPRVH